MVKIFDRKLICFGFKFADNCVNLGAEFVFMFYDVGYAGVQLFYIGLRASVLRFDIAADRQVVTILGNGLIVNKR